MRSSEFKLLAFIQTITLILVLILVIDRYVAPPVAKSVGAAIATTPVPTPQHTVSLRADSTQNHVFGLMKSPHTLMIFSSYNCVYCRQFYATALDSMLNGPVKEGNLKVVCKDFVNPTDELGMLMAKTAEVARQNGKFETLHRLLISGNIPPDSTTVMAFAIQAGLTQQQLTKGLNSEATLTKIQRDYEAGKTAGVTGTPSFILHGELNTGYMYYKMIAEKI